VEVISSVQKLTELEMVFQMEYLWVRITCRRLKRLICTVYQSSIGWLAGSILPYVAVRF